jgi:hypothetical protein
MFGVEKLGGGKEDIDGEGVRCMRAGWDRGFRMGEEKGRCSRGCVLG